MTPARPLPHYCHDVLPQPAPPYFASDDHALLTGMLMGHLMTKGVEALFEVDTEGHYTDVLVIKVPRAETAGWYTLHLKILPPEIVA